MSASASLICAAPGDVAGLWPHARAMVLGAITRTGLSHSADIEADILAGHSLLWLAWNGQEIEAAAATKIVKTDAAKVCILVACGGSNRKSWFPLLAELEAYARGAGCSCLRIFGRKGWARLLTDYRVAHVVLERSL